MRKHLNVIRTPWCATGRIVTTDDLNGVFSLEDMSSTPVSSREEEKTRSVIYSRNQTMPLTRQYRILA